MNGILDLVDFFPLHLNMSSLMNLFPPEQGYRYLLSQADGPLGMVEGLIVKGMAAETLLTADAAHKYLEDPVTGIAFAEEPVQVISAAGLRLSEPFLKKLKDNQQAGIILLEGRKASRAPLVLEVRDRDNKPVLRTSLPLEIVPVEQMYGHKNLRAEAGDADGEIDRFVDFTWESSPDFYKEAKQPYCMQGEDKSLVWMYGYNVSPAYGRATYAEVFKRFFHAGLNGRFYGVSWFGDPPAPLTWLSDGFPTHFHQSVVNAFATAEAYKNFITAIPSATTAITAHSLGNLVVGSAINDFGLEKFDKYFAIDAAVALEAYGQVSDVATLVKPGGTIDATIPNAGMVNVGKWPMYIDGGQTRLLASEWYKLFERFAPQDNRTKLTWRKRLLKVPSVKVYNFYSSTEDVLRRYDEDNVLFDGNGWSNSALAIAVWVKQEKFKGLQSALNIADNFGGVSSPYCGWGFGDNYKEATWLPPFSRLYTPEEAAARINDEDLLSKPFFALGDSLDALASPAGSAFVDRFVRKDSFLDQYYTANDAAHDRVKIRDWLLAEAFPATTLPMGANENGKLTLPGQNIDMSGVKTPDGGCCKTREDLWPRKDTYNGYREWRHSDYKDMPYLHVYEFYKTLLRKGGL
ncbi:MAG: hypothetical protein HGA96_17395 [Desulfobulbaceae bacterium]|nr:hypothetical protein [Desulfobulbaceae bacterium]